MVSGVQKAFPACVRSVKRGDVYYADFGSVEDAVGHELAKKRPVLIIQNNLGNKKSTTTILPSFFTQQSINVALSKMLRFLHLDRYLSEFLKFLYTFSAIPIAITPLSALLLLIL